AILLRWLPPLLWFVTLATLFTLLTRQGTFSALLMMMAWGGLYITGPMILLWCRLFLPLHPFVTPDYINVTPQMYSYNRWLLLFSATFFTLSAINMTRNEERVLGIAGWRHQSRQLQPIPVSDRFSYVWLLLAGLLFYATANTPLAPLAAWLAPIFLWRFLLSQPTDPGFGLAIGTIAVATFISWYELVLFGRSCHVAFSLTQAIVYCLPFIIARLLWPHLPNHFATTLLLPLLWVVIEAGYARINVMGGTMGAIAYTQADYLPLLQLLAVTGMAGISFLMLWLAGIVNWVWQRPLHPTTIRPLLGYTLLLIAVWGGGWARLTWAPPPMDETMPLTGFTQLELFDQIDPEWNFNDGFDALLAMSHTTQQSYLARTATAIADGAEAVIWPEANVLVFETEEASFIAEAQSLAANTSTYLFIAMWTIPTDFPHQLLQNKTVLITPLGTPIWEYWKAVPVPGLEWSEPGDGQLPFYQAGTSLFSTAICYDMDFPQLIRPAGRVGVDVMWVPAHDISPVFTPWHAEMAIFRAIENGFSLVRQTSYGLSLVTDYQGRILASVNQFTTDEPVMVAEVPLQGVRTIYGRWGDWFVLLCLLLLVGGLTAVSLPTLLEGNK
ncbi:MAG TPA: nitrilase-related carbon-nitrogen hydrolase, partial [Anaerolineae bacterium]|nr:nitrilase-related carbon-nitrogen hydrolase [Anaerolineae bacterium]